MKLHIKILRKQTLETKKTGFNIKKQVSFSQYKK